MKVQWLGWSALGREDVRLEKLKYSCVAYYLDLYEPVNVGDKYSENKQ